MFWQNLLVAAICLICACTDLKSGKIYNRVTYSGAAAGIALSLLAGLSGVMDSFIGLLGGFILYATLYKFKGVAAGDVKLMAAIGALKGFPFVIYSSFYILCFACLFGLCVLAWQGRLIPAIKWIGGSVVSFLIPGFQRPVLESGMTTMAFAPSIFLGTVCSIWLESIHGPFVL